jgi:hypothetical protein
MNNRRIREHEMRYCDAHRSGKWLTAEGELLEIEEMETGHIKNALALYSRLDRDAYKEAAIRLASRLEAILVEAKISEAKTIGQCIDLLESLDPDDFKPTVFFRLEKELRNRERAALSPAKEPKNKFHHAVERIFSPFEARRK